MGVSRKLGRWFLGRSVNGRTEVGGAMVRGLVSCAILGGTVLGFNVIAATSSGAALNTPVFIDVNGGTIQYDGTGQFGWAYGSSAAVNSCPAGAVTVPGIKGLFNC